METPEIRDSFIPTCVLCGDVISTIDYLTDGECPTCRASFLKTEFSDDNIKSK